jgi:UDP-N-acetylmuramyl pentapeptide phosphotransferase/UDP-N-acetylglucosamine-1-phosphate transferase
MLCFGVLSAFGIAFAITVWLTPRLLVISLRRRWIDPTGSRKIHTGAASRLGGFAFFPALVLAVGGAMFFGGGFAAEGSALKLILGVCGAGLLYGLGAADDLVGVRYRKKLLIQLLAASLAAASGIWIRDGHGFLGIGALPPAAGIALTVLLLVFVMNAVNLIDGIDGLAALLSIGALTVYGAVLSIHGERLGTLAAVAGLGVLIPFLYYNVRGIRRRSRSKIFMGDAGSLLIGFLLAILAVASWNRGGEIDACPSVLAFTMLLIPCFDAVRVFFVRILRRKPLFLADNSHIHHRLLRRGFSPVRVLWMLAAGQAVFLLLNLCLTRLVPITAIAAVDLLLLLILSRMVARGIPFADHRPH